MLLTRRPELPSAVKQDVAVAGARLRNGLKHLSGLPAGPIAASEKQPLWTRDKAVLYRYTPSRITAGPPVLLVMSLITKPQVFDLRPGSSLVEDLLTAGFDVFVLDWGVPDAADSHNGLETYCDEYLPAAVVEVARHSGAGNVTLLGYCLGGLLSLMSLAGNPHLPVVNLVTLAVPVDMRQMLPLANLFGDRRLEPEHFLDETGNLPAGLVRGSFKLLQPTAPLSTCANLWRSLVDEADLAAHQALIGWSQDHIPFPGRAFVQIVELFFHGQRLQQEGCVRLGGREVQLSSVHCRVLNVIGTRDHLVPPQASAPLAGLLSNAQFEQLHLEAGHAGLFVGRRARTQCVPAIIDWLTTNG